MRTTLRVTLAAVCAAGAVAAPPAAALDTVIRIEGASQTLLPESAVPLEGTGTATVVDRTFATVPVDRSSAFWQLYRATAAAGLQLGFEHFPAFDAVLVQRVGPDENAGSVGWQYRVNRRAPAAGASALRLSEGDRVLWFYGAPEGVRELDVALSSDRVRRGEPFTVTVASWDADGRQAPAAGARVSYGGALADERRPAPGPRRRGRRAPAGRPGGRRHGAPGQPARLPSHRRRPHRRARAARRRRPRPLGCRARGGGARPAGRDAVPLPHAGR